MLYPLMIAIGLALLALAALITPPSGKLTAYACSLASFIIAAIATTGVFH
jgi:hypothetical protein